MNDLSSWIQFFAQELIIAIITLTIVSYNHKFNIFYTKKEFGCQCITLTYLGRQLRDDEDIYLNMN